MSKIKPILEFLKELEEPYKTQAIKNFKDYCSFCDLVEEIEVTNIIDAIYQAFTWSHSPEGGGYWASLVYKLQQEINQLNMSEYSRTVYKKDTKGKIRFLTVSSDNGKLIQESGIVGGKATERESMCKAKNVGRANETTPEEQARLEAQSKIETKMSTGYFDTIEEAEGERVILPMLAKSYDKEKKKVTYPCYVQPKLDGMRCLIIVKDSGVTMISRKGKEIDTLPHILRAVEESDLSNVILDGELYVHGETFQKNISLIKKYRPGESEKIQFRIYDVVNNQPYEERMIQVARTLDMNIPHIGEVETLCCIDEHAIKMYHDIYVEEGYEGAMVRWGEEGYKVGGRSSNLLKMKDFLDEAYEVVDVEPSDKNPEQGVVVCRLNKKMTVSKSTGKIVRTGDSSLEYEGEVVEDYPTFGCGMKFSHEEREEILTNKHMYIGQIAEVRFFEFTDDGLPRFPVCVGFRIDK